MYYVWVPQIVIYTLFSSPVDPDTWAALQKRFECQHSDVIEDIYDGEGYKKHLQFLSNPAHIVVAQHRWCCTFPFFQGFDLANLGSCERTTPYTTVRVGHFVNYFHINFVCITHASPNFLV